MSEQDYLIAKSLRGMFGFDRLGNARTGLAEAKRGSSTAAHRLKTSQIKLETAEGMADYARHSSHPTRGVVRRSMVESHKRFGRYPQMPPHKVRYGPKGDRPGTVYGDILNRGAQGRDFADFPGERYSRNLSVGEYRAQERAKARAMDDRYDFAQTHHRAAKYSEAKARAGVRRAGAAEQAAQNEFGQAKRSVQRRVGGTAAGGVTLTGAGGAVEYKRRKR